MKKEQIILRTDIKADDPQAIERIVSSTGFFRPDEIKVAVELAEERLEKGIESGYEFVFAEIDNQVVAYTCFGLIPCSLISYDLYWIATNKDFQGRGLGKLLLQKAEEMVLRMGGKSIYIETSGKDLYAPTQGFYLRNGYLLKVRMDDFYEEGDDKLVYVKRVGQI
jgi:ribosomal protein S18 acetylase RimI-like enzyme